ncbi:N-formylglutamate amidohydrolase [Polaribacter sp. R2A056_3_33]|uniref:N-formylglutamate amidohydrolase n=1 Tax=Polaribacter sp. R2A056_3_33 TaxID=2745563 RepID=UPI001C4E5F56|nr:N-formylglutamate amidohydrolase [Polaribacter sp. R2A056_3_33]QXP71009.1 N-formylglutamate amidohydrolase [Polaribacter sp. R2A056_3_33]
MKLVITCEHGGNEIPEKFQILFNNKEILNTHKGFDLGALDVFNALKHLAIYTNYSTTSRLLIELNRSLWHKNLFSEYTKHLSNLEKKDLIKTYYNSYRNNVENEIETLITNQNTVVHLSIHSFTPILNDRIRNCDIGLLYDSSNQQEKKTALQLKEALHTINPNWHLRFNYPYLGKADGFTTHLRKRFKENYIGIEIELNQKFSKNNIMNYQLKEDLQKAISNILK